MGFFQRIGLAPIPDAVALDERSLEVVAELDVGGLSGHIGADPEAVWITTHSKRKLSRIDPATRTETVSVKLPEKPQRVAPDAAGPVVLCDKEVVVRVDPAGGAVATEARLPEGVSDLVASAGFVWGLRSAGDHPVEVSLIQLDPASLAPVREVRLGTTNYFGGLRTGDGVVSALVEDPPGSMRERVLDLATGADLPDDRAPKTRGIAERDGLRWVSEGDRGFKLLEIASGRTIATGEAPGPRTTGPIVAHGLLWTCNYREPQRGGSSYQS